MEKIFQCYLRLNGHFPINLKVLYFKGQKITREDFNAIKDGL
jgi:hypothetical protein